MPFFLPSFHMSYSDISPFSVAEYHKNQIVDLIRYKTGWNQRWEVYSKAQLNYIDQYLNYPGNKAQTLVIEYEYVDRHYLEDYSEYYARCFPSHPRTCARVHFFSTKFNEKKFLAALRGEDDELITSLQKNYIGFAVLRPIPKTCFAKLCLAPYSNDNGGSSEYKVIKKRVEVSLFGIKLEVESAPFLEQDKAVSACATSAIWTFLSASKDRPSDANPSPSAITKSALDAATDGVRTFPNNGLSAAQVCRSLKYFDFEPTLFYKRNEKGGSKAFISELKEYVYSHVSADVPLILGGDVYDLSDKNKPPEWLGKHLVCVLGYKASLNEKSGEIYAHGIEKLYVHDDRYGPYVRLEDVSLIEKNKASVNCIKSWLRAAIAKISGGHNKEQEGFQLSIINGDGKEEKREVFIPDVAIVGLYHKVRIPYPRVFDMHRALLAYVDVSVSNIDLVLSKNLNETERVYRTTVKRCYQSYINGVLQVSLITNAVYKDEIRRMREFGSFNGIADKVSLLTSSLPKYIWRCRVLVGEVLHSDVLIDATEIQQGQVIIGVVTYTAEAELMWKNVELANMAHEWARHGSERDKELIGGYIGFFQRGAGESNLNTIYGPLKLPNRGLKTGEFDDINNVTLNIDVTTIVGGDPSSYWRTMDPKKKYIWVVNCDGHLVVGEDVEVSSNDGKNKSFQGHPTLVNGLAARLGGEFFNKGGQWYINLKSRAYPAGCEPQDAHWYKLLDRIIQFNINGLDVTKEPPSVH